MNYIIIYQIYILNKAVELFWDPSRIGIHDNEEADKVTRNQTGSETVVPHNK